VITTRLKAPFLVRKGTEAFLKERRLLYCLFLPILAHDEGIYGTAVIKPFQLRPNSSCDIFILLFYILFVNNLYEHFK
jgi:hypothetical protein